MTKLIVIDPGHGGIDSGAVGNGLQEKNVNLDLARQVQSKLNNLADVVLTRNSDTFVSLADRADRANKLNADLFVSLHVNAGGGTGFESYIYNRTSPLTAELQNIIHKEVVAYFSSVGVPDRGPKRAAFAVLRQTAMPAVLLENLFIDNKGDAQKLKEPVFLDGLAKAVSSGIVKAMGIQPPSVPATLPPVSEPKPHWAQKDYERIRQAGLVMDVHNLYSQVTWGELSAVLARLLDKLGR